MASNLRTHLHGSAGIVVVRVSQDLAERAAAFYASRLDKGYSIVDCESSIIMRERGICEVLAHDKHFVQEGFKALMRY